MGMFFGNINPKSFLVGDKIVSKILRNTTVVWEKNGGGEVDDVQYLCFTAEQAGSTVRMIKSGSAPTVYLETSPTGEEGTWTEFIVGSTTITLANVGDKVYFRAKQDNEKFAYNISGYNYFEMTGKIAASGNINTLLKADGSVLDLTGRANCYFQMFQYCTSLTKAPELPATTLAGQCYYRMFQGCTSLTQAPELPATTLVNYCYSQMFDGCTSLTQAPELPATTLTEGCYRNMFDGCISLTQASELPATTLASGCYECMFSNCYNLQTITINADENNEYAYNALFEMFNGATSLNEIRFTSLTFDEAKTLLNNSDVAQGMFNNVDPLYVAVYFEDGYYSSLADLLETELKCLKFTNTIEDGNWTEAVLILENSGPTESEPTLVCSRDSGSSWERFYINNQYYIQPNESIMIRAEDYTTNSSFSNSDGYFRFSNNYDNARPLKVEGNLRWLISMEESSQYIESEFMFNGLFEYFKFTNDSNITIPKPYNPYGDNNMM